MQPQRKSGPVKCIAALDDFSNGRFGPFTTPLVISQRDF